MKANKPSKNYMKARYGAAAKEIQDKVDTITDLYILTHLLDDIFAAETREEIERLIDEAITKQSQMNQSTKQLEKLKCFSPNPPARFGERSHGRNAFNRFASSFVRGYTSR